MESAPDMISVELYKDEDFKELLEVLESTIDDIEVTKGNNQDHLLDVLGRKIKCHNITFEVIVGEIHNGIGNALLGRDKLSKLKVWVSEEEANG